MTNAAKIRRYFLAHPNAKPADVAARFKVKPAYVYVIRSKMKAKKNEKGFKSIDEQVQGLLNKPTQKKDDWVVTHVSTSDEAVNKPKPTNNVSTDVDATLAERGKRYGTFKGHAAVTYQLKNVLRAHADAMGKTFAFDQAEALDMICHKLGRIVNGDPNYADSWVDIAGYAKLVADRLETGKEV